MRSEGSKKKKGGWERGDLEIWIMLKKIDIKRIKSHVRIKDIETFIYKSLYFIILV